MPYQSLSFTYTWRSIDKISNVLGGDACVTNTRIPVWALEGYRRLGLSDAQILENFPTLCQADLDNVWAYVAAHPIEVEEALHTNQAA